MKCKFEKAWIGSCNKDSGDSEICEEHTKEKCVSCGEQAVRECAQTGIQFVCGCPLCATCQHGRAPRDNPGMFNLGGGHVTEEVHKLQWPEFNKVADVLAESKDHE
jgi:hypothetical protein